MSCDKTDSRARAAGRAGSGASLAAPPAVDLDALLHRCMGNRELVTSILLRFQAQLLDALQKLQGAVAAGNSEQVSKVAHTLKGTAATLSAEEIRNAAAQLEAAGRRGDLAAAPEWLTVLSGEAQRYVDQIAWLAPSAGRGMAWPGGKAKEPPCAS